MASTGSTSLLQTGSADTQAVDDPTSPVHRWRQMFLRSYSALSELKEFVSAEHMTSESARVLWSKMANKIMRLAETLGNMERSFRDSAASVSAARATATRNVRNSLTGLHNIIEWLRTLNVDASFDSDRSSSSSSQTYPSTTTASDDDNHSTISSSAEELMARTRELSEMEQQQVCLKASDMETRLRSFLEVVDVTVDAFSQWIEKQNEIIASAYENLDDLLSTAAEDALAHMRVSVRQYTEDISTVRNGAVKLNREMSSVLHLESETSASLATRMDAVAAMATRRVLERQEYWAEIAFGSYSLVTGLRGRLSSQRDDERIVAALDSVQNAILRFMHVAGIATPQPQNQQQQKQQQNRQQRQLSPLRGIGGSDVNDNNGTSLFFLRDDPQGYGQGMGYGYRQVRGSSLGGTSWRTHVGTHLKGARKVRSMISRSSFSAPTSTGLRNVDEVRTVLETLQNAEGALLMLGQMLQNVRQMQNDIAEHEQRERVLQENWKVVQDEWKTAMNAVSFNKNAVLVVRTFLSDPSMYRPSRWSDPGFVRALSSHQPEAKQARGEGEGQDPSSTPTPQQQQHQQEPFAEIVESTDDLARSIQSAKDDFHNTLMDLQMKVIQLQKAEPEAFVRYEGRMVASNAELQEVLERSIHELFENLREMLMTEFSMWQATWRDFEDRCHEIISGYEADARIMDRDWVFARGGGGGGVGSADPSSTQGGANVMAAFMNMFSRICSRMLRHQAFIAAALGEERRVNAAQHQHTQLVKMADLLQGLFDMFASTSPASIASTATRGSRAVAVIRPCNLGPFEPRSLVEAASHPSETEDPDDRYPSAPIAAASIPLPSPPPPPPPSPSSTTHTPLPIAPSVTTPIAYPTIPTPHSPPHSPLNSETIEGFAPNRKAPPTCLTCTIGTEQQKQLLRQIQQNGES